MANEQFTIPRLPYITSGYGLQTPFGILLPPGGRVAAYVRSTGAQDYDDRNIIENLVTTLASGLARCRSGLGDTVILLPGHTESVADATMLANLVAGTRIIGIGRGSAMPVLRWTATGSQWALNKADVQVSNLRLRLEGVNGVVKAILVTGANSLISGCEIQVASGAALKATIALEYGAGSDGAELVGNIFYGTATHNVTDGVKVVSAIDRIRIADNEFDFSATAANGNVHFTAAATKTRVLRNYFQNDMTVSTACLAYDAVAVTGLAAYNQFSTINNGVAAAQGITLGAGCLVRCFENYSSDEPVKSGVIAPGVVAT